MTAGVTEEQQATVNRAMDYINRRLTEPLRVEAVADHCCYSRHHFNRLFKGVVGESVYAFLKRQKLEAAASMIFKYPALPITDVAAAMGYSSSNFAVAFKNQFGFSPYQCRRGSTSAEPLEPRQQEMVGEILRFRDTRQEELLARIGRSISVRSLPELFLHYRRFIGPYCRLEAEWRNFYCEVRPLLTPRDEGRFYGVTYSDPLVTAGNRCFYDLCVSLAEPRTLNCHRFPGGDYLCYRYSGPLAGLFEHYHLFLSFWVPASGRACWFRTCLESYHYQQPPGGISLDICIPLNPV